MQQQEVLVESEQRSESSGTEKEGM